MLANTECIWGPLDGEMVPLFPSPNGMEFRLFYGPKADKIAVYALINGTLIFQRFLKRNDP